MNKGDLSKHVRKQFLQEISERLPQFEPQGGKGKISLSGWRSFIWTVADDLHFFVGLGVDASGDMFTVEGGWNASPDYPAGQAPIILLNITSKDFDAPRVVFRPGIKDKGGVVVEKSWWETRVAEEEDIQKLITDAVQLIQQEFVRVFAKRAMRKGVNLDE